MADTAYLGIGSNIATRLDFMRQGITDLREQEQVELLAVSSVYETEPVGYLDQARFLNAVFSLSTSLMPAELLALMQESENRHGRQRSVHWGPRTLDLDLLLYGDLVLENGILTIPHAHLTQRCFVLCPLLEISPQLRLPGTGQPLARCLEQLDCEPQVRRLPGVDLEDLLR